MLAFLGNFSVYSLSPCAAGRCPSAARTSDRSPPGRALRLLSHRGGHSWASHSCCLVSGAAGCVQGLSSERSRSRHVAQPRGASRLAALLFIQKKPRFSQRTRSQTLAAALLRQNLSLFNQPHGVQSTPPSHLSPQLKARSQAKITGSLSL